MPIGPALTPESSSQELPALVFAVNDAYCLPLVVAWQSFKESNPTRSGELGIHVLFENLSAESEDLLRRNADRLDLDITLHRVDLGTARFPVAFGGDKANYLRLLIPEVLSHCRRVLYLDADLLIRGSIDDLLRTELQGHPVGAVRDPVNPAYRHGRALPGWSALGLPGDREYFNSGVLLIDIPACLTSGVFRSALRFAGEHPQHIRLWDQDALNWAAADDWRRLPLTCNVFPLSALIRTRWIRYTAEEVMPLADLMALEEDASILHFATPAKPWKGLLPSGAANSLYHYHLTAVRAANAGIPSS